MHVERPLTAPETKRYINLASFRTVRRRSVFVKINSLLAFFFRRNHLITTINDGKTQWDPFRRSLR